MHHSHFSVYPANSAIWMKNTWVKKGSPCFTIYNLNQKCASNIQTNGSRHMPEEIDTLGWYTIEHSVTCPHTVLRDICGLLYICPNKWTQWRFKIRLSSLFLPPFLSFSPTPSLHFPFRIIDRIRNVLRVGDSIQGQVERSIFDALSMGQPGGTRNDRR